MKGDESIKRKFILTGLIIAIGILIYPSKVAFSLSDNTTVSQTRTSSTNNLPSSISYDDGIYAGILYGQGSTQSVVSGSDANSKFVSGLWDSNGNWVQGGRSSAFRKWDVWAWTPSWTPAPEGQWVFRGTLDSQQHDIYVSSGNSWSNVQLNTDYLWYYPILKSYNDGVYSGTLTRNSDPAYDIVSPSTEPPHDGGLQILNTYLNKWYYNGTIYKPDDRVYKYTQVYTGTVYLKAPPIDSNSVEIIGNEYTEPGNNVYWVQQNNPFTIKISGQTDVASSSYKINQLLATMKDEKNSQVNFTGSINNSQLTSAIGSSSNGSAPIQLMSTVISRTNSITAEADFSSKISQDGKTYSIYPVVRLYDGGDYTNPLVLLRESTWWEVLKKVVVKSDGIAPTGIFTPNSSALSIRTITTTFTPYDSGSGVDHWQYQLSKDGGLTYGEYLPGDTYTNIVLTGEGLWKVHARVVDKVGNVGDVYSETFNVVNPKPKNGKLEVTKFGFQEYNDLNDDGIKESNEPTKPIYWVKQYKEDEEYNKSEFEIYTDGYFPSNYNIYPTRTYLLYAKDGIMNLSSSGRQYADEYGSDEYGSEYANCFNFTDGESAELLQSGGNNYIKHTHKAEGINHGEKFKLFFTNSFIEDDKETFGDYVDSGDWLKVDGKAPEGNGLIDLDLKTLNMTITASSVTDPDSGVGADSVWAMIYPLEGDNNITPDINDFKGNTEYKNSDKMKKKLIRQSNGLYKLALNAYDDAYKSDKVKVVIGAIDNVGNIGILKDETEDLFTIRARIVPLNNMDYDSDTPPTLERGQAGVLIMEVTGCAESLDIEYQELDSLDDTLDKTITINPVENYKMQNDKFIVPLYCDEKQYKVKVVAHKGDRTREAYPEMIVSDSVLNGIRTRVR